MRNNPEKNPNDGRVRYAKTLFVDRLELNPEVNFLVITRNKYILELHEHNMRELYEFLGERLKNPILGPCRIAVIGREVE